MKLNKFITDDNLKTCVEFARLKLDNTLKDYVAQAEKGVANGIASLNESGKIPTSQIPGSLNEYEEYDSFDVFPVEGISDKIYLAKDTNKSYRWTGSGYHIIGSDLAIGETAETAYAGDKGKQNRIDISELQNTKADRSELKALAKKDKVAEVDLTPELSLKVNSVIKATADTFGGIKASAKTEYDTQEVHIDNNGKLFTLASGMGPQGPQGEPGQNGADGQDGKPGEDGAPGKSAYDIAKELGYKGTVEEWLASLKGEQGIQGEAGPEGPAGADGAKGEPGIPGQNGQQGIPGEPGKDGHTPVITINENDFWVIDGIVTSTKAKGDKGDAGTDGKPGADGQAGQPGQDGRDGATGAAGKDGKSAYEVAVDNGFVGSEAEWLASLKGESGATGPIGPQGPQGPQGEPGVIPADKLAQIDTNKNDITNIKTNKQDKVIGGANISLGADGKTINWEAPVNGVYYKVLVKPFVNPTSTDSQMSQALSDSSKTIANTMTVNNPVQVKTKNINYEFVIENKESI